MLLLLVEDNPGDARLFELACGRLDDGRTLRIALDGEEALHAIADPDFRPSLIILDWNLPWLSGEDLLREIKSNPKTRDIPVVVLSGSTPISHEGKTEGLIAFLPKPDHWEGWKQVAAECWSLVPKPTSKLTIPQRVVAELRSLVASLPA